MKRRIFLVAVIVLGTAVLAFVSSVLLWHRSCKHTHMRANAHARGRAHPHTCTRR